MERALDFITMKNEASAGEGKAGTPPPLTEDEILELQRITREMHREEAAKHD